MSVFRYPGSYRVQPVARSEKDLDKMAFWRSRKSRVDPDKAWQRQNHEQHHNVLYQYINLQRQGRLVEVYRTYGLEDLKDVIRDEIGPFLYNDGKGKLVSKAEISKSKRGYAANTNVRYLHFTKLKPL